MEDEPDLIELHTAVLKDAGYDVMTARDGAEAFEQIAGANGRVRLIVSDLHLPVFSAIEMYTRIQSVMPAPPILVCSGMIDAQSEQDLATAAIHFLAKPFSVAELLEKVALLASPV